MKRDQDVRRIAAAVAQSQTDSELFPAQPGFRLRVLGVQATGPTATALTFNSKASGVSGTAISPAFTAAAGVPTVALDATDYGWFQTLYNESLTVTTGAGGTTAIVAIVSLEPAVDGVYDELMIELLYENGDVLQSEAA